MTGRLPNGRTDRRVVFATAQVAHISLKGKIDAPRFSAGTRHRVATPTVNITAGPDNARLERQARFGQSFTVLDTDGTYAFGRADATGYVGCIPRAALRPWAAPTHRLSVNRTLLFAAPDFKSPNPVTLPLGAELTITGHQDRYACTDDGRHVMAHHIEPMDMVPDDPVAVAEQLLGTPYLWGGNSALGIDCSGLVEQGLTTIGHPCPGDSDQQEATLGTTLSPGTPPKRGDLMFWKGHVAWVSDPETLLHANAHHMVTTYEPIATAVARIAQQGDGPVTRHARLG